MKIFMYSDLHICKTSSILPSTLNGKYTYRQQMIIDTGKYLASIIDEERPDLIVNLGDTFDQHTITSYDVDVASKFFECFRMFNIPHLVIVGNHEMVNRDFNAIKILSNINNITVISEPGVISSNYIMSLYQKHTDNETKPDVKLAFLPYCSYNDIFEFPEGTFLFSHQDIQDSVIRGDFKLPEGLTKEQLSNYKLVFNGHIHKPSIFNNVINVGSITTHSFSDDEGSVPQCYLFDTDTLNLVTYKPTICPLFRKFEIKETIEELEEYVDNLDSNYKYILHIISPFALKEQVKQYLDNNTKILNSKLNVRIDKNKQQEENVETENLNLQANIDIKQTFTEFINTVDLKYPKDYYLKILENIGG